MAYQKQTWVNLPDQTTPISADRLNHMENGIYGISVDTENCALITEAGYSIEIVLNTTNYKLSTILKDKNSNIISTSNEIDLPLESVVVSGTYDSTNKKIVLTLQNGSTIDIPVGDLINGLQSEITSTNKLASDLVDDTNNTNKFVTTSEKTVWNNKSDFSGNYNDLTNKPTIPTSLSDLSDDSTHRLVTDTEKSTWSNKQDSLVSGTNIKTINNESILGSGNLTISGGGGAEVIILQDSATNPSQSFIISQSDNKNALEKIYANFNDKNFIILLSTYNPEKTNTSAPELIPCLVEKSGTTLFIRCYGRTSANSGSLYGVNYYSLYRYDINASFMSSGSLFSVNGNKAIYKVLSDINWLGLNNTTTFTPTNDYNPATKKYVDDKIGDIEDLLEILDVGSGV